MNPSLVYISSSKSGNPYGITVAQLNDATGELTIVQQDDAVSECQYLGLHPNGKYLYATTMDNDCEVVSFKIDDTGKVSAMNRLSAAGGSPRYVSVDDSHKNVLMVNYNTKEGRGNVRIYPIDAGGQLQAHTEMIEHDGGSVNPDRQQESHPHMIVTTPDNRFAIVPDLGTDTVYVYALDTDSGTLSLHTEVKLHAGAGPRHVSFHPALSLMYVINELDSTLDTFFYNTDNDTWTHRATISTLPDDFPNAGDEVSYCADVHVHPNGKFLYGSNRGHDSIVIFALGVDGIPSLVGHESTRGHWPRAFMITANGKWLVVGNRHTDTAEVFAIDAESGLLTHTSSLELPSPIAFKMMS